MMLGLDDSRLNILLGNSQSLSDQSAVHFKNPHYYFRRLARGWIIATSNKVKPTFHPFPTSLLKSWLTAELLSPKLSSCHSSLPPISLPSPSPQPEIPPSSPFPCPSFSSPAPLVPINRPQLSLSPSATRSHTWRHLLFGLLVSSICCC